jgi:hypothetical protein
MTTSVKDRTTTRRREVRLCVYWMFTSIDTRVAPEATTFAQRSGTNNKKGGSSCKKDMQHEPKTKSCWFCKEEGHVQNDCSKLKALQELADKADNSSSRSSSRSTRSGSSSRSSSRRKETAKKTVRELLAGASRAEGRIQHFFERKCRIGVVILYYWRDPETSNQALYKKNQES